jgi:hypothetical protein
VKGTILITASAKSWGFIVGTMGVHGCTQEISMTTKQISYKHNNKGAEYPYLALPKDMVFGDKVKLEEIEPGKSILITFVK